MHTVFNRLPSQFAAPAADGAEMAEALREALAAGRFTYAAQPLIDLATGGPAYRELLVRFELPFETAALIQAAEAAGLISQLDLAAVRMAATVLRAHPTGPGVCINISGCTLSDPAAAGALIAEIEARVSYRRRLVLEITESGRIGDLGFAGGVITALRTRGCQVWLDDFGAGFAALPYLQALDVDGVKIDGAYIAAAARSPRDARLLRAIAAFCEAMGVCTTAEKIETAEQADLVRTLGLTYGQGYFFGRPALPTAQERAP